MTSRQKSDLLRKQALVQAARVLIAERLHRRMWQKFVANVTTSGAVTLPEGVDASAADKAEFRDAP